MRGVKVAGEGAQSSTPPSSLQVADTDGMDRPRQVATKGCSVLPEVPITTGGLLNARTWGRMGCVSLIPHS